MSCREPEPIPTEFYAPQGWFSDMEGVKVLGDRIYSPGFSHEYQVISGPLCRIFWENDKPMPNSFESAWECINGKWKRERPNYLSYQVKDGSFITVRWVKQKQTQTAKPA